MIKTWQQRCDEHPDHQQGIVTQQMIQDRMQEEIDELRQALAQPEQKPFGYFQYDIEWDGWVETEPNDGKPLYIAPPNLQEMLKQAYLDGVNSGVKAMQLGSEK